MEHEEFNAQRRTVAVEAGEIGYADVGSGPAALFVHGAFVSSHLWRNAIGLVRDDRRCIAVDLPVHGRTRVSRTRELTFPAQAEVLVQLLDALELDQVDVVAHDTGGAVAQVFAARNPERVRTLTLTNCDVHENVPPPAFKPIVETAARGELAPNLVRAGEDPAVGRQILAVGYEDAEGIPDATFAEYLGRFADEEEARELERFIVSLKPEDLMAVEPQLRQLQAPTQIVWGREDVFFEERWARWLEETIPGVTRVVALEEAKLFFPDERPEPLASALREHWTAHAPAPVEA